MKKDREDIDELMLLKGAVRKGHKYVLCIESSSGASVHQTNTESDLEMARMLERFAHNARQRGEAIQSIGA